MSRDIKEALNWRKVCTAFNRCGGLSPCILPAADHEEQQETSHGCLYGYTSLLCYPKNSYSEWEDKHGPHQVWEIVISRKGHRANNAVAFLSEVESYQDVEVLERDKSSSKTASSAGVWASKFLWLSPATQAYVHWNPRQLKGYPLSEGLRKNMWLFQIQKFNLISHRSGLHSENIRVLPNLKESVRLETQLSNRSITNQERKPTWLVQNLYLNLGRRKNKCIASGAKLVQVVSQWKQGPMTKTAPSIKKMFCCASGLLRNTLPDLFTQLAPGTSHAWALAASFINGCIHLCPSCMQGGKSRCPGPWHN